MNGYDFNYIMGIVKKDIEDNNYVDIYKLRDNLNLLIESMIENKLFEDDFLQAKADLLTKNIILLVPLMTSDMSSQTTLIHIFKRNKILCLADLIQMTNKEVSELRNLGTARLNIIKQYLEKNGLNLGTTLTVKEKEKLKIHRNRLMEEIYKEEIESKAKVKKYGNISNYTTF